MKRLFFLICLFISLVLTTSSNKDNLSKQTNDTQKQSIQVPDIDGNNVSDIIFNLCAYQKSQNDEKSLPLEAYKMVLQNKGKFFSTDDKKYVYLSEFDYFYGMTLENPLKVTYFTVLDMNGDKIPEVVLNSEDKGIEVLNYIDGVVYGYNIVNRALMQIKTDGTFNFSSGAADSGYGKLRFSSNDCETDVLGYSELSFNNDILIISYFINQKPVTEISFNTFCKEQDEKEDVDWYEFTQKNIETKLSIYK